MEHKIKVLVGVPYHEQKRYCLGQLYDSLEAIARSAAIGKLHVEMIVRHDLNPFGQKDNVKTQREFFRQMAVRDRFDYLFFHGADTMPPADVLFRLIGSNKPVVSGIYYQRGEKKAMNAIVWNDMKTEDKNEVMRQHQNPHDLLRVEGFGLDCVLIHRSVFEKIGFMDWDVNDDDYPFCDAVKALGLPLYVNRSVQCIHWSSDKEYSFNGQHHSVLKYS